MNHRGTEDTETENLKKFGAFSQRNGMTLNLALL